MLGGKGIGCWYIPGGERERVSLFDIISTNKTDARCYWANEYMYYTA
jgi:hypothetical protein